MSNMKKKIGKQGLNGLLNRKEKEKAPESGGRYTGSLWDDDDDDFRSPHRDAYGGFRYNSSAERGYVPGTGRRFEKAPGTRAGKIAYVVDQDLAVVKRKEMRRLAMELGEIVRNGLQYRGITTTLGGDGEIVDLMEDFIRGCRVHSGQRMLRIAVEED